MTKRQTNHGFRILDDFVSEARHEPDVPHADGRKPGRNEGMQVVSELVLQMPSESTAINLDQWMRQIAGEVAAFMARQVDPIGMMTRFHQEVIARIKDIQNAAKPSLDLECNKPSQHDENPV